MKQASYTKNMQLQNRFPDSVRALWFDWHSCNVCFLNQFDVLHHIISPSVRHYVQGSHNMSALNSCPIHNYTHPSSREMIANGRYGMGITKPCHIGNEPYLHHDEIIPVLLGRTLDAVLEMGYFLKEIDRRFLDCYAHLYDDKHQKMLKLRGLGGGRDAPESLSIIHSKNRMYEGKTREELEARAAELNVEFTEETSNEDLVAALEAADEAAKGSDDAAA